MRTNGWRRRQRRGLYNLRIHRRMRCRCFISQKNVDLFTRHHIFTEPEMHSRYEILLENYCKVLNIEALTMLDMARKEIVPAVALVYQAADRNAPRPR